MSDGALTQEEIDRLLSNLDKEYEQREKSTKKALKRSAQTSRGLVRAIRDNYMGEYSVNFTLTNEEAERLIIRYAKAYRKGKY
jgi:hypothetical protein